MPKVLKKDIHLVQVSSVSRNDKNFGKQHIFDDCEDTCWSSDEGSPQWIMVELKEPHCVSSFNIQFQGGFVGQDCKIELKSDDQVLIEPFYPEDVNSVQKFLLSKPTICNKIKFLFNNSTDFFGRIVVYSIDILV